jgi:hypothetical protein
MNRAIVLLAATCIGMIAGCSSSSTSGQAPGGDKQDPTAANAAPAPKGDQTKSDQTTTSVTPTKVVLSPEEQARIQAQNDADPLVNCQFACTNDEEVSCAAAMTAAGKDARKQAKVHDDCVSHRNRDSCITACSQSWKIDDSKCIRSAQTPADLDACVPAKLRRVGTTTASLH